jgi:hypothetical protein
LALAGLCLASTASAALFSRTVGTDEMIYDSDLNVTWLKDANYAKTSGYSSDGLMTWDQARDWAAQLVYGGKDDWRLPGVRPVNGTTFHFFWTNNGSTDFGQNITSPKSELAYMYYVNLGNLAECAPNGGGSATSCINQPGWGLKNVGPFINLILDEHHGHWSGTVDPSNPLEAVFFHVAYGEQDTENKQNNDEYFAWAVRSGDVAAVPLPAAVWLFGSALTGLVAFGRRNRRRG